MNVKRAMFPFKRRLLREAVLFSLSVALIGGGTAVTILSLVFHLLIRPLALQTALYVGGGVFAALFILMMIWRYPRSKTVAARMDALGLEERTATMLAYRDDSSEIALLQRRDAINRIRNISPKQLPLRRSKWRRFAVVFVLLTATGMMLLPTDILLRLFPPTTIGTAVAADEEDEAALLIARLRENVKRAKLEEHVKKKLSAVIDALEEDLKYADNELEQAIKIEQAENEMQEILEEQITKIAIGAALQRYPMTAALGTAVSNGDTEAVKSALDELETILADDSETISALSETIQAALDDSGGNVDDKLFAAFFSFYKMLDVIDIDSEKFQETLTFTFDSCERAVLTALEAQNAVEDEMNELGDIMGDNSNDTSENERPPEQSPPPSGSQDGSGPANGQPSDTMTEEIFDPVSGSVNYGEVFATYYAEYLKALENGEISPEMQEIFDRYYTSLS